MLVIYFSIFMQPWLALFFSVTAMYLIAKGSIGSAHGRVLKAWGEPNKETASTVRIHRLHHLPV